MSASLTWRRSNGRPWPAAVGTGSGFLSSSPTVFSRCGAVGRASDPRRGLLADKEWRTAKPTVCRTIERSPNGETEIAALATQLGQAYRRVARNFDKNPNARIEIRNGKPELVVTPLDRLDQPPSLLGLKSAMKARLPKVDLSDVLMEVENRTGFAQDFTHVTERRAVSPASGPAFAPCPSPRPATSASNQLCGPALRRFDGTGSPGSARTSFEQIR